MKLWVCLFLTLPWVSHANTFVGNGGGAGDVELSVTKKQIAEAFRAIDKRKDDVEADFCSCSGNYQNRSVCEPLRSLNDKEREFCGEALSQQAQEILRMVNNPNAISFRWTNESIRVADRGETRAVDAVTHREKREITISLKRFLELKPFERVFLLTHEMLHLTSLNGKPMMDEGTVGPFQGEEGGRRLLNAMGASAAVMQSKYPREINSYQSRLNRSQSWKRFWLGVNSGTANMSEKPKGTFASDEFTRTQLTAHYALGDFVLGVGYRLQSNDKKVLDGAVTVEENVDIFSVGLGYRIFPFRDPETFWGQSHFVLQVMADYVKADLKLSQGFDLNYSTKTWGGSAALNYYLPLFWSFWGYAGVSYELHPYKYDNVNVNYEKNVLSQYLGVSFAF